MKIHVHLCFQEEHELTFPTCQIIYSTYTTSHLKVIHNINLFLSLILNIQQILQKTDYFRALGP